MTSLFLCWRGTAEKIVYIFLQDFSKKKTLSIPVSCRFFVQKTDDILRTLLLMHDGISFGKILPKQVGYCGTWINWKQRRGLVLQVPHWVQSQNRRKPTDDVCRMTRHLFDTWEKNRGQNSTLFHQGLNIISPGTHFILRFEGSELTIFSLLWKKGQVIDTSVTGYK
jgi:hypothetical protein